MESIALERVNSHLLDRQHLSPGTTGDIAAITGDIAGLHATRASEPYLALFARSPGFRRQLLDEKLYNDKKLLKMRCMRGTLYILTREMLPAAYAATIPVVEKLSRRYAEYRGLKMSEYPLLSATILEILHRKPLTVTEIKQNLNRYDLHLPSILNLMCDQGLLARLQGSWRSQNYRYTPFAEFFPGLDLLVDSESEAINKLIQYYLRSFGPVTINDITWWTGLPKAKIAAALAAMGHKIMHIGIPEIPGDFIILSAEYEIMQSSIPINRPVVNILPGLDPYIMGYKKRDRYLDHRHYNMVFDGAGNATTTILYNGKITGIWDIDEDALLCKVFLLDGANKKTLTEIEPGLLAMGEFITGRPVIMDIVPSMTPLTRRTYGGFMSPLKDSI